VTGTELILAARSLADEESDSPEYGRALVDLVTRALGHSEKDRSLVSMAVFAQVSGSSDQPEAPGSADQPEELSQPLTKREREVLTLVSEGMAHTTIAKTLFISKRTVDVHIYNITLKTGTNSVIEALGVARRAGLLANPPAPQGRSSSSPVLPGRPLAVGKTGEV
jgi:DNA-binding NarL/FixJ family response regulator